MVVRVVIVAGVAGSGKTTVCELLAQRLDWPFVDGDSLHPASNIAKMSKGVPLTDQDRFTWLRHIAAWTDEQVENGRSGIIACSALKRHYRAELLDHRPSVGMAFLLIDPPVAERRLAERHGHFFDPDLLASQFADLEVPTEAESGVLRVGADQPAEQIVDEILLGLGINGSAAPRAEPQPGHSAGSQDGSNRV